MAADRRPALVGGAFEQAVPFFIDSVETLRAAVLHPSRVINAEVARQRIKPRRKTRPLFVVVLLLDDAQKVSWVSSSATALVPTDRMTN